MKRSPLHAGLDAAAELLIENANVPVHESVRRDGPIAIARAREGACSPLIGLVLGKERPCEPELPVRTSPVAGRHLIPQDDKLGTPVPKGARKGGDRLNGGGDSLEFIRVQRPVGECTLGFR